MRGYLLRSFIGGSRLRPKPRWVLAAPLRMRPDEMTFALPGSRLAEVTEAVERTAVVDSVVARYTADDARRFASAS
jgi:hypothetical protein